MSAEVRVKLDSDHVRDVADHYPTPLPFCHAALRHLPFGMNPARVLDPGAGLGPWGQAARTFWPRSEIHGIEINPDVVPDPAYDRWFQGTFITITTPKEPKGPFKSAKQEASAWERYAWRLWASQQPQYYDTDTWFDLIVGNPPYADAEEFVRESMRYLRHGGVLAYLLRLAFLEGQDRSAGLWREFPAHTVAVASKRPSFTGNGKTDATAYAMYYFVKGYDGPTFLKRIDWDY